MLTIVIQTARKQCRLPAVMALMVTAATTALLLQSTIDKDDSPRSTTRRVNDRISLVAKLYKPPYSSKREAKCEEKLPVNEELFRRRREKAAEACRQHVGYDPDTFDPKNIKGDAVDQRELNFQDYTFYDDNFRFIFCTIPKVASTNIKEVFTSLLNRKPPWRQGNLINQSTPLSHIHRVIELDTLEGAPLRMTYHPRIIVVRHPIERLISAWRDKLLFPEPEHPEIDKIAKYIISKYRPRKTSSSKTTPWFPSSPDTNPVTLVEFFKFLVELGDGVYADVHWRKYVHHCDPCRVSYDYIAHYENLDQELGYIMNITTGIPNILSSSMPKPANDSFAASTNGDHTVSLQKTYAENVVPPELVQQVVDRYAADFDIFGYDRSRTFF